MAKLFKSKSWSSLGRPRPICFIPEFMLISRGGRTWSLTLFSIIARMPANNNLAESLLFEEELHFLWLRRVWKCALFRIYQIYQAFYLWLQFLLLLFMIADIDLTFTLPKSASWVISGMNNFSPIAKLAKLNILFGYFSLLEKSFI